MKIINASILTVIVIFLTTGLSIAQDEDGLLFGEDDEMIEEVVCVPDTLKSNYDQFKDLEISSMELRQMYSFGSEYFKNKSYTSALPYLWKVFLHDTAKYGRNAIRKIADSYFNMQMADSTLIASYRGLALFPDQVRLHYYAGYIQENLGKFTCAIPHYEALVESDPTNIQYLEKLAFLYFKNKDIRAIEIVDRLIEIEPENSKWTEIKSIYISELIGDGEELLAALKEAYDKNPDVNNSIKYAEEASNQGKYLEALGPLTNVIEKLDPKNVKAYRLRATSNEGLERYTSAINDYKKIADIEPQNAAIMCAIANVYRNQNEFSKGRYWINQSLKAKPGFGLAYITMGEIYESAVTFCQKGRGRKYDDGLVYNLAYQQYSKAANDPAYKSIAKSRRNNLKPYLPTKEEKFMNQNRTTLKIACYTNWIN